jgi:hypothetical protein
MAMVYQNGKVYEKGKRVKKWYGQFRLYMRDRNGREVERTRKVILGLKSELRKYKAEEKLRDIIRKENGKIGLAVPAPPPDVGDIQVVRQGKVSPDLSRPMEDGDTREDGT